MAVCALNDFAGPPAGKVNVTEEEQEEEEKEEECTINRGNHGDRCGGGDVSEKLACSVCALVFAGCRTQTSK